VRISQPEGEAIAAFLGMNLGDFLARMTRLTGDRRGLSLIERTDGACVFYHDAPPGCQIYPVRPRQCRAFPQGWNFPGWRELCAGGNGASDEDGASVPDLIAPQGMPPSR